jgi:hypothetical protein
MIDSHRPAAATGQNSGAARCTCQHGAQPRDTLFFVACEKTPGKWRFLMVLPEWIEKLRSSAYPLTTQEFSELRFCVVYQRREQM